MEKFVYKYNLLKKANHLLAILRNEICLFTLSSVGLKDTEKNDSKGWIDRATAAVCQETNLNCKTMTSCIIHEYISFM